jgi:hypothetical protein
MVIIFHTIYIIFWDEELRRRTYVDFRRFISFIAVYDTIFLDLGNEICSEENFQLKRLCPCYFMDVLERSCCSIDEIYRVSFSILINSPNSF